MAEANKNIALSKAVIELELRHPVTEIHKATGYGKPTVSEYLSNKKVPTEEFFKLFAKAYQLDYDQKFAPLFREQIFVTGEQLRARKVQGRQQKGILAVPVKAQAGYTRMLGDDFRVFMDQLDRIVVPNFPYDGDDFRAFEVEGDSMEYVNESGQISGIPSGMWVVGQNVPHEDWATNLSLYRIHVIVFAREILIKRILQDNPNEIVLHSDNDHYPQERRSLADVKEIWYIVRKLDWDMPPPRRITISV